MRSPLKATAVQNAGRKRRTRNLRMESLEGRRMLAVAIDGIDSGAVPAAVDINDAASWQNQVIHEDVDNSGFVSLNDLLEMVSDLRENGVGHTFPPSSQITDAPRLFVDVNGDNVAAIDDLMQVLAAMRDGLSAPAPEIEVSVGAGEGESAPSNATISGQIVAGLTEQTTVAAQIDSGDFFLLELDAQGRFTIDPGAFAGLTEGEHTVRFYAQNRAFNVDTAEVVFTFTNESPSGEGESVDAVFAEVGSLLENVI